MLHDLIRLRMQDVDYDLFIKETLLWSNKIRSTFYFIAGLLVWLVVRAVCLSPTTLPTGKMHAHGVGSTGALPCTLLSMSTMMWWEQRSIGLW